MHDVMRRKITALHLRENWDKVTAPFHAAAVCSNTNSEWIIHEANPYAKLFKERVEGMNNGSRAY